jgi:hypothetical protein
MTSAELKRFQEATPLLSKVLHNAKKPVVHNKYKLQADDADTCGRWAVARIKLMHLPLHSFVAKMTGGSGTPDQNVTKYTYSLLKK